MLIDRRYFFYFDWLSFFLTIGITCTGLAFIYSTTTSSELVYSVYFKKQCFGALAGLCIYLFFCLYDYRKLCRIGYFAYFAIILLLMFTLLKGKTAMGGKRWIDFKLFKFQPSEVAKLFFPSFLTYYLYTENDVPLYKMHTFMPIFLIVGMSTLLILKQPDLGTAIIFLSLSLIMLWFSGIETRFFKYGFFLFLCSVPVAWNYVLKPYQKKRILVFLGTGDTQKEGYHIKQSKIAIGSGQLTGKGFMQGTQNKLMFLPESRTDFIFSVFCEEMGFLGALVLMLSYMFLVMRLLYRIEKIPIFFARLLSLGLLTSFALSIIINIAMVCDYAPVVGIPLPLMSYGVTSLWITLASLGWIQGILMRTF